MRLVPYGDLLFFYIMFIALIPAVILGLFEKRIKIYGLLISLIMLCGFIGKSKAQYVALIAFYFGELILIKLYSFIRKKTRNRWIMRLCQRRN